MMVSNPLGPLLRKKEGRKSFGGLSEKRRSSMRDGGSSEARGRRRN